MAKMKVKTKSWIKRIALVLAGVAALTAVAFGVKAIVDYTKNDLKKLTLSFDVGNLGADGKYVNDESTLYTKDAFACDGLQIKLDFDNEIDYQIFYYDDLDNFVSSTDIYSEAFGDSVKATHARLVIIPTNDEDNKISFKERITYPGQMTVKVAKEQRLRYATIGNKRLLVVHDQHDLIFRAGDLAIQGGNLVFDSGATKRACTSVQFLDISKYKSMTPNNGSLSGKVLFWVYQFKDDGTSLQLINSTNGYEESITFEKGADLLLIVIKNVVNEQDVEFTEAMCKKATGTFILK